MIINIIITTSRILNINTNIIYVDNSDNICDSIYCDSINIKDPTSNNNNINNHDDNINSHVLKNNKSKIDSKENDMKHNYAKNINFGDSKIFDNGGESLNNSKLIISKNNTKIANEKNTIKNGSKHEDVKKSKNKYKYNKNDHNLIFLFLNSDCDADDEKNVPQPEISKYFLQENKISRKILQGHPDCSEVITFNDGKK